MGFLGVQALCQECSKAADLSENEALSGSELCSRFEEEFDEAVLGDVVDGFSFHQRTVHQESIPIDLSSVYFNFL